jgi:hypothetical protein
MAFDEILTDLAEKTDPTKAECLRSCARLRLILRKLAEAPLDSIQAIEPTDAEIEYLVFVLVGEHWELAERFDWRGMPIETGAATPR